MTFYDGRGVRMIFLSTGLKYQDKKIISNKIREGKASVKGCPITICDMAAPDMTKKKPAYAHSFNRGAFGISMVITPKIFHAPIIDNIYKG